MTTPATTPVTIARIDPGMRRTLVGLSTLLPTVALALLSILVPLMRPVVAVLAVIVSAAVA